MVIEPNRIEETGGLQMLSITDVVISSGPINIPPDMMRMHRENVTTVYSHFGRFGRTQGYQEPG